MIRIAPEGRPFIIVAWLMVLAAVLAGWWLAAGVMVVIATWVVAFFRDPVREGERGEHLVIAPADGKVVSIIPIDEPDVIKGPALRISIFMNVFNVHVNRYPSSGEIIFRRHRQGAFFNAATEKAALENEQSDVGIRTSRGRILVRQIAGLVARRIITDHPVGQHAVQGARMGLIRFGSRVDVFVPAGSAVRVKEGEHTQAGITVIAEWP
ncbi:MAG TPA: phosphatidylserine decarboxylase family protein [Gemmatimonadales bacterium]|nr:phosphatidylserine decarboxylase family protein [Gemmatimonadales bacterium]